MSNNNAVGSNALGKVCCAALFTIFALASCGGGGGSTSVSTDPSITYTLTVTNSGGGTAASATGDISCGATCSASFASGTNVTLTATPTSGYSFTGWSGACSGTGACSVTMSAAMSVSATFTLAPPVISVVISAVPTLIAAELSFVISWSSTNSTSCSSSPVGITGTAGSYTTPPLTTTTPYTITCVGPGGSTSQKVASPAIISAAAACATAPLLSGTVYYYCDCGTGAQANCIPGNDTNSGTSALAPRQTIGNAATRFSTMLANETVALCKGGAFNATASLSVGSAGRCAVGTSCNDIRDYTPSTFTGTAKPIVNNAPVPVNATSAVSLFSFTNTRGGVRILNLKLKGDGGPLSWGVFLYNDVRDVTMCNLDMDSFGLAVHNAGGSATAPLNSNIKLTGSLITNSGVQGYLGAGNNTEVSYNYWDGNGSSSVFDHTIYIGSHVPVSGVQVVGNYVHGQYGPTCLGAPIVGHGRYTNLLVANNVVDIDATASAGGCWGIDFDDGGYSTAAYLRNAKFSGNTIKNGGNVSLTVANCPDCVIENNLIMQNWTYGPGYSVTGIVVPTKVARVGDDVSTRNLIRNNTVWFGPNSTGGGTGIKVGTEGTGHVIANNTIYYSATSVGTGTGVNCFDYSLPLTPYAFINNNHCYSAATFKWEATRGNLAAWQTASGGFDMASLTGVDPLFTALGTNFTPATGSPLIGAGNAANGSVVDLTSKTRASTPAIGAYEH